MFILFALLVCLGASAFIVSSCVFITAHVMEDLITEETKKEVDTLVPFGVVFSIIMFLIANLLV